MARRGLSRSTLLLIVAAVLIGVLTYWLFRPRDEDPFSIQPMVAGFQRQNELTVFRAQVVTVPTTKVDGIVDMLDRVQTSIIPARVRYTLDLSRIGDRDVSWDPVTKTATVTVPPVIVQPAELDAVAKRVFRTGPPAAAATWDQFDRSNAIKAGREARELARAPELMRMAEESARDAVAGNAALFLRGAGIADAKVVVRFANERRSDERVDGSTPLNAVLSR